MEDFILRFTEAFKKAKFRERKVYPIPCLLFLSTDLPQKSGLEVLQWIRQEGNPLRIRPVILFAISAQKEEMKKALALGVYDYVLKSMSFEELVEWAKGLKSSWLESAKIFSTLISYLVN